MKGKFPTIVMAVMALVLALSLAVVGPANDNTAEAGDLSWTTLVTPTMAIGIYPWTEVDDFALSPNYATDSIMYAAVTDPIRALGGSWASNFGIAKSTMGGIMWSALPQPAAAPAAALMLAVAPDDSNYIVISDGATVWASGDGGGTWSVMGTLATIPAVGEVITSVGVGPSFAGVHPIAIGTTDIIAATYGDVYVWGLGSPPASLWTALTVNEDVTSVAVSPNYTSDMTIVAVGSHAVNLTRAHLYYGVTPALDPGVNWPIVINAALGVGDAGAIVSSVAVLPADFNGGLPNMRIAFVGTNSGVADNVYRVRDGVAPANALGAGLTGVNSLDMVGNIGGSAALIAGDTAAGVAPYANLVYTTDPWSAAPWWSGANKPPTGAAGNALVAFASDYLTSGVAFCATGGAASDESALSKTVNSGLTWNQISLIDTNITETTIPPSAVAGVGGVLDMAASPDYATDSTLFMATSSEGAPTGTGWDSLWISTMGGTLWERIDVFATTNTTAVVRVSPEYGTDSTVYWAETGAAANVVRVSTDGGGFFTQKTVGWAGGGIADMVVEDGTTVYVASAATAGKSTDAGSTWATMGSAFSAIARMIQDPGTGDLLLAGGGVIYSITDTATMTIQIQAQVTGDGPGSIQYLAFDPDYATNNIAYAAGGGAAGLIWKIDGVGTLGASIKQIANAPTPAIGLAMSDAGVLYCADTAAGNGVWRSVNPDDEPVTLGTVPEWLAMVQGFASLPGAVTISGMWLAPGDVLFIRDENNDPVAVPIALIQDRILVYGDTMPMTPTLSSPANGATGVGVQVGQLTGVIMYYATVEWGAISGAYGYGLQIDSDDSFANPIVNIGVQAAPPWLPTNPLAYWTVAPINQPATSYTTPAGAAALLNPDTEYFWRARVDNTALGTGACVGQWSSARSFNTGPGIAPEALTLLSPKPGDTDVSVRPGFSWAAVADATSYEFELSDEDGALVVQKTLDVLTYIYDLDDDLDEDATYSWSVR